MRLWKSAASRLRAEMMNLGSGTSAFSSSISYTVASDPHGPRQYFRERKLFWVSLPKLLPT